MTSKSSCSINLLKEERAYTRRRTAPALLVFFVYFTEFVLGALLAVVHTREYTAPSALQGELIRTGNVQNFFHHLLVQAYQLNKCIFHFLIYNNKL